MSDSRNLFSYCLNLKLLKCLPSCSTFPKDMAGPAFGFSVGDFVTGIELLATVAAVLKDASRAKAESHEAITYVESLLQTFHFLKEISTAANADAGAQQHIWTSMLVCQAEVKRFESKLKKYDCILSPANEDPSIGRWVKKAPAKAWWALRVKDDVLKMK